MNKAAHSVETSGKTVDDAISEGLHQLGISRSEADITILEGGSRGFLGLGSREATVRITARVSSDDDARPRSRGRRGGSGDSRRSDRNDRNDRGEADERPERSSSRDRAEGSEKEGAGRRSRRSRDAGGEERSSRSRSGGEREERRSRSRSSGGRGRDSGRRVSILSEPVQPILREEHFLRRADDSGEAVDENPPARRNQRGSRSSRNDRSDRSDRNERGSGSSRSERSSDEQGERSSRRSRGGRSRDEGGDSGRPPRERRERAHVDPDIDAEAVNLACQVLDDLMRILDIDADILIREPETPGEGLGSALAVVDLEGDNMGIIIGRGGETLTGLQYVVNVIVSRHHPGNAAPIYLDAAGYRKRREIEIVDLAQRMGERVARTGQPIVLEPMSPAERRIVHITLADNPDVATASTGVGASRKVQIRPA